MGAKNSSKKQNSETQTESSYVNIDNIPQDFIELIFERLFDKFSYDNIDTLVQSHLQRYVLSELNVRFCTYHNDASLQQKLTESVRKHILNEPFEYSQRRFHQETDHIKDELKIFIKELSQDPEIRKTIAVRYGKTIDVNPRDAIKSRLKQYEYDFIRYKDIIEAVGGLVTFAGLPEVDLYPLQDEIEATRKKRKNGSWTDVNYLDILPDAPIIKIYNNYDSSNPFCIGFRIQRGDDTSRIWYLIFHNADHHDEKYGGSMHSHGTREAMYLESDVSYVIADHVFTGILNINEYVAIIKGVHPVYKLH